MYLGLLMNGIVIYNVQTQIMTDLRNWYWVYLWLQEAWYVRRVLLAG